MRTREQRWAARSARGWPRLRVFAIINGFTGLLIGSLILWFTHGVFQFENFPAAGVPWIWRVLALAIAVTIGRRSRAAAESEESTTAPVVT